MDNGKSLENRYIITNQNKNSVQYDYQQIAIDLILKY